MPRRRSQRIEQQKEGDEDDEDGEAKEQTVKEGPAFKAMPTTSPSATAGKRRLAKYRSSFLQGLIEYETPRLVKVHNVWLGIVIRISQILVIAYVATYAIMYERGYQVNEALSSSHACVSRDLVSCSSLRTSAYCTVLALT